MFKLTKTAIALGLASAALSQSSFADSFNIENPDKLKIEINYGNNEVFTSQAERISDARNPKNGQITIIADDGNILKKNLISSKSAPGNKGGCNYSMLISKNSGWRLNSYGKGCSASEDNYNPETSPVYSIINDSAEPYYGVYPAFARENEDFSADSQFERLKPNELRMYSGDTGYWKALHVKTGDKIRVGFFNEAQQNYISCSDEEVISEDKTFVIKSANTCEIYIPSKPMEVGIQLEKKEFNVNEADRGISVTYKTPATGAASYCLYALKSDKSKFGGYKTGIKPNSEGKVTLAIHKQWSPQGGKFDVGISENCNTKLSVKPVGLSEQIMIKP